MSKEEIIALLEDRKEEFKPDIHADQKAWTIYQELSYLLSEIKGD